MIPNIGPRERRKRVRFGIMLLGVGVLAAAVLLILGAPRMWRASLLLPFWLAGLGFFQARDKT